MKLSARIPRGSSPQSIRATAKGITEIDLVPPRFSDCSELFISENSISKIDKIEQFRWLSRLMIEYNLIRYVDDLLPLGTLANLVELRIEGNPVCRWPLWDIFTISICLKLRLLNGKLVVRDKRQHLLEFERKILDAMYYLQISKDVAAKLKGKPPPTPEELAQIVADAMAKRPKQDFIEHIRAHSGAADADSYFDYLTNLAKRKGRNFKEWWPGDASKFQAAFAQLNEAGDDLEAFVKAVGSLATLAFEGVGVDNASGVKEMIADALGEAEGQSFLEFVCANPAARRTSKPKLPFLNLQQMQSKPSKYSPKLSIHGCPKQGEFEHGYAPSLEIHKNVSFEMFGDEAGNGPGKKELNQFHSQKSSDDEDQASKFDQLVQQTHAEEAVSQKYDESEYFSETSNEKSARKRRRISSWMEGTSGSETTPPSSARSRRDRRDRRQSLHDNMKLEQIREFASRPSGFLVWKFFKVWTLRHKQRINTRMRRKMLSSTVSGMIARMQPPKISLMLSSGSIPQIESTGKLQILESSNPIPGSENRSRLHGSASFLLSARERKAFPIPILPSGTKDRYNQQLKQLVGNPIGNILVDQPLKRVASTRNRSRSDLSAD